MFFVLFCSNSATLKYPLAEPVDDQMECASKCARGEFGVKEKFRTILVLIVVSVALLVITSTAAAQYNITGNVTVVGATDPATTPLIVVAYNETRNLWYASFGPVLSDPTTETLVFPYNVSNLPTGNYTVFAFLDFNGNNTPDSDEPQNASNQIQILNGDVSGVDLVIYNATSTAPTPQPAGTVNYTISGFLFPSANVSVGLVEVYAFNSSLYTRDDLTAENVTAFLPSADNSTTVTVIAYPAQYSFQVAAGSYYVVALLNESGNYTAIGYAVNASDVLGMTAINVTLGDNTSANITLYETTASPAGTSSGTGTVSQGSANVTVGGTVYYSGIATGTLHIAAYNATQPLTESLLLSQPVNVTVVQSPAFPYAYSLSVPPGFYWVIAFLDLNASNGYDPGEPVGFAINATSNATAVPIDAFAGNSTADVILNESNGFLTGSYYGNYTEGGYFEENFTLPSGLVYWYPETCNQSTVNVTVRALNWSTVYNSTSDFMITLEGTCFYGVSVDSNGTADIGIQPGEYRVVIYEAIPPFRMIEVGNRTASEGGEIAIDFSQLDIPEVRSVTVRVLDSGAPVASAEVVVYSTTAFLGYGITDQNGNVTINGIDGNYTAQVMIFGNYTVQTYTFSVSINNTTSVIVLDISSLPTLAGYVLKDGTPVSGAFVSLYSDDYLVYVTATTNSSGYYSLSLPSYGTYNIRVDPGFSSEYFTPYEDRLDVNQSLTSSLYNISVGFANGVKLSGYVTDTSGRSDTPMSDVLIWTFSEDTLYYAYTFTNDSGYYELELPAGTYEIHFDPTTSSSPGFVEKVVTLSLAGDTVYNVTFDLADQGNMLSGWIVDGNGQPVTCSYGCGWIVAYGENGWNSAEVGSDGYYEMYLPSGDYTVEFYPYSSSYTTVRTSVSLSGDTVMNLTVSQGYSLSGQVLRNGQAVSYADVYLYNSDTWEFAGWTSTDYNGNFVIHGLSGGNYTIEVYSPTAGYYSAEVTVSGDVTLTVDMSAVGGYTLDGTILPSGSADVYIYNDEYSFWTYTDNGTFSMAGIPPGNYTVQIYHYDLGMPMNFEVSISSDTSMTFDFGVSSTTLSSVRVTVVNETGSAVSGASVSLYSDTTGASNTTDSNGVATFQLPDGTYSVVVQADGYYINATTLTVSGDTSLSIALESIATQTQNGTTGGTQTSLVVNITSLYDSDVSVWITVKDSNATSDRYYAEVFERTIPAGQTASFTLSVPAGTYKVAVLYPVYSNGVIAETGEVYQLNVTVPGSPPLEFTVPGS